MNYTCIDCKEPTPSHMYDGDERVCYFCLGKSQQYVDEHTKSFDDVLKEIEVINKDVYDGSHWSIFGRGFDQVWGDGDEIEWKEAETYNIDSVVLQCPHNFPFIYYML